MFVDGFILFTLLVLGVYGYRKGFTRQIFALLGIVSVYAFAMPLAGVLEKILQNETSIQLHGPYAHVILLSVSAAVLYITCFCTGAFLRNTLVQGIRIAEKTDRIFGASLGIVQSTLMIFFILCLLSLLSEKVERYAPEVHQVLNQSHAYKMAHAFNFLTQYQDRYGSLPSLPVIPIGDMGKEADKAVEAPRPLPPSTP
ncbi:MAG: CvpA family protein [Proteobacteria bacterium]|nr:CvpA family protein [Pseudomonadota bacterium]